MSDKITRRGFVKGAALAGAATATAVLAGCGGEEAPATNEDGSVKKILRFGQSNPKLGLDMQISTNSGSTPSFSHTAVASSVSKPVKLPSASV